LDRVIFHVDCNKFFASVECLHRPEIRDFPVAVCGSTEERHGIVLTANQIASSMGVKTAQPIWQAMQKCPDLITVAPNYPLYMRFSNLVHKICCEYTDKVESFGLDECWLDVSDNVSDSTGRTSCSQYKRKDKGRTGHYGFDRSVLEQGLFKTWLRL